MRPLTPSLAKILLGKSPAHAKAAMETKLKPTREMELGEVTDYLVFGGKLPKTLERDHAAATPLANAAMEFFLAQPARENQPKLQWRNECTECSGRADAISEDRRYVWDLKTAADCADNKLIQAIEFKGYDLQMAAYREAVQTLYGTDPECILVFVEKQPPYEVRPVPLSPEMLRAGAEKWQKACRLWKQCWETGNWPGRGQMIAYPSRWNQPSLLIDEPKESK